MTLSEELDQRLGGGSGDRVPRDRMRLIAWKSLRSGTLLGFASVELPIGLRINDCPVMLGKNGLWANLPSKPRLDRDGQKRTTPEGKTLYEEIMAWNSKKLQEAFSDRVVALVQAAYPADLE